MKKVFMVIALMVMALAVVQAQTIPYYGEIYDASTNRLVSKTWVAANGNRRWEEPATSGNPARVNIYIHETQTIYILDMSRKTAMSMPYSQFSDTNNMLGMRTEESRNSVTEFIRQEEVEGKMCNLNRLTITTVQANGQTRTTVYEHWIWPPINTWVQQRIGYDTQILRNITQGDHPAHLFEVPSDFRIQAMPALPSGGFQDLLPRR